MLGGLFLEANLLRCPERSSTRGFTLIELMVTVAVVGILVTIAIPMWHNMRDRAFVALMQSDLRNLAVTQEAFFFDNQFYAPDVNELKAKGFRPSAGVQFQIAEATRTGWSASASNEGTLVECHLFVGSAAPVGSATRNGVASCA